MTASVPPDAVAIPRSCFLDSFSLNLYIDIRLIRIGDSRQTRIDAIEAFAIWMPVYWAIKKMVTPKKDKIVRSGTSSFFTRILLLGFLIRFRERIIMKRKPAMRNRKVAMAIGLKSSLRIAFTITNELPQKVIKNSIRMMFVRLMCLFCISTSLMVHLNI